MNTVSSCARCISVVIVLISKEPVGGASSREPNPAQTVRIVKQCKAPRQGNAFVTSSDKLCFNNKRHNQLSRMQSDMFLCKHGILSSYFSHNPRWGNKVIHDGSFSAFTFSCCLWLRCCQSSLLLARLILNWHLSRLHLLLGKEVPTS